MSGRYVVSLALLIVLSTASLVGQGLTGQLSGSIQDSSGGAMAGVQVMLANDGTGQVREMVSDTTGAFVFAQLLAGTYTITISAPGFKKHEEKGIVLSSSERAVVRPITLEVGGTTESISVTAQTTQLQTQSAERSGTLTNTQLLQTPQKGRHFLSLLTLMPGVINNNNFEGPSGGGIGGIRINGSRAGSLTVTSDGVPNMDTGNQQGPHTTAGSGVNRRGQSAAHELSGRVRSQLRRQHHHRHQGRHQGVSWRRVLLQAQRGLERQRLFPQPRRCNARNRYRYDYPGYYIGGPILIPGLLKNRDKLFFFWSQEFLPRTTPTELRRYMFPTALERQGDFSQTRDTNGAIIPILDPLNNRVQFPGNMIPPSRIDKAGQGLLNVFPMPNASGSGEYIQCRSARENARTAPFRSPACRLEHRSEDHLLHATPSQQRQTHQRRLVQSASPSTTTSH